MYDSIAGSYDQESHDTAALQFSRLASSICVRRFERIAGLRILDVGCGTGVLAGTLAAVGAYVIGLDMSFGMLQRARARIPGWLVCGDALQIPLGTEFDVVTACNEVVNQWDLRRLGSALKSIRSCLGLGGLLLFDAISWDHFSRYWDGRHWEEGKDGTLLWMDCRWLPEKYEGWAQLTSFRTMGGRRLIETSNLVQYWHPSRRLLQLLRGSGFELVERLPFTPLAEPQPEGFVDRVLYVARAVIHRPNSNLYAWGSEGNSIEDFTRPG